VKFVESKNGAHTIPMVNKALELVRVLAAADDATTTKALALRLGLPRSSCYRILRSLVAQDWIRPVAGGRHELSPGLLPVLEPLRRFEVLAEAVNPVIRGLALRTQLTVKLTVRQGDDAVTIARCESPQGTSVGVRVGASFPLPYGSSGAVLLSDLGAEEVADILQRAAAECWQHQTRNDISRRLRELRSKGWCADLGTFRPSCFAVSAPVRDAQGRVAAALTVLGFPHEMTNKKLPEVGRAVADAAQQAGRLLRKVAPRPASHGKHKRCGREQSK
jgi:IclR family acetate operon transcriptional repressor